MEEKNKSVWLYNIPWLNKDYWKPSVFNSINSKNDDNKYSILIMA